MKRLPFFWDVGISFCFDGECRDLGCRVFVMSAIWEGYRTAYLI